MDSLHSKIRDWKARGGLLYCITKLDIELEGHRADCNEAGGTSCADQPTVRYILHSEGTPYANISLGRFVSEMQVLMKVVQLVPWQQGVG